VIALETFSLVVVAVEPQQLDKMVHCQVQVLVETAEMVLLPQ
jgi:hypothetical protein